MVLGPCPVACYAIAHLIASIAVALGGGWLIALAQAALPVVSLALVNITSRRIIFMVSICVDIICRTMLKVVFI